MKGNNGLWLEMREEQGTCVRVSLKRKGVKDDATEGGVG